MWVYAHEGEMAKHFRLPSASPLYDNRYSDVSASFTVSIPISLPAQLAHHVSYDMHEFMSYL